MQARHYWGEDIELAPRVRPTVDPWDPARPDLTPDQQLTPASVYYDLALVVGTEEGQQAVLRRILTAPAELLFHREYGAGLPSHVGRLADPRAVRSLVRSQMLLEARVADTPPPEINTQQKLGTLSCQIRYVDAPTSKSQALTFALEA